MKKPALTIAERQPVAVRAAAVAAVTAVVHVFVVLGVVDVDVETAITGAVDALGTLTLVVWTIRSVTPNAKVVTQVTNAGEVVAGDAAAVATGTVVYVDHGPIDVDLPHVDSVAVRPELVTSP